MKKKESLNMALFKAAPFEFIWERTIGYLIYKWKSFQCRKFGHGKLIHRISASQCERCGFVVESGKYTKIYVDKL